MSVRRAGSPQLSNALFATVVTPAITSTHTVYSDLIAWLPDKPGLNFFSRYALTHSVRYFPVDQNSHWIKPSVAFRNNHRMAGDINIVAIVKGDERYVFMFDEDSRAETLRTLGRYASNPELSFSWYDAAVLSQKIRKVSAQPKFEEIITSQHPEHPALRRGSSYPTTKDSMADMHGFPDIDFLTSDDQWIGDDPIV